MRTILASVILLLSSCTSNSQPQANQTPEHFNKEFFKLLESKGGDPALTYLFSSNKWIKEHDVSNVKAKLKELTVQVGKYYGSDLITKKSIGQHLFLYSYLVRFERQPIRFLMTYYRSGTNWQLQFFEFDPDFQTELREAAAPYRLDENLPGN